MKLKMNDNGIEKVLVHFERPTEDGFSDNKVDWEMYERVVSGEMIDEDDYKKLVQWLCERHAIDEIMDLIWHEKYRDK